jgi:hypothetical protein
LDLSECLRLGTPLGSQENLLGLVNDCLVFDDLIQGFNLIFEILNFFDMGKG